MADEKIFPKGMIVKLADGKAAEFVKCRISIKTDEFVQFLHDHTKPDGWVNIDIKEAISGKWYSQLNHWTKETTKPVPMPNVDYGEMINPDDIPFS